MNKNYLLNLLIVVFVIVLYHIYKPIYLAILSDGALQDFQWQPAKCVFEGVNHYASFLTDNQKCPRFMSQNGQYAQGLYVMFFPLTLLEWDAAKITWSLLNLILIIFTLYLLCRKFELPKAETVIIIFFVLYSKVMGSNLYMGQQSILILFFLILPFVSNSKLSIILSGISYFKYNIGYALFLFYLISLLQHMLGRWFLDAALRCPCVLFGMLGASTLASAGP